MPRPAFLVVPPFALAILAAGAFGWTASGAIEAGMRDRVERTARAAGFDWLDVRGNGTVVTLRGVAPDLAARDNARAVARETGRLLSVRDKMTVAPPAADLPPSPADPVGLSILRDAQGATLTGAAPGEEARERIVQGLTAAIGGTPTRDFATDAGGAEPEGWRTAEAAAISAAGFLLHGRIALSSGQFSVSGVPVTEEGRAAIERTAQALATAGLAVDLALLAPQAAPETLVFDVENTPSGVRIHACEAADALGAAGLIAAIERAFDMQGAPCRMIPGGDVANWSQAARAGITVLATGTPGRFQIKGRRATLTAAPGSDGAAFAAMADRLEAALPKGFTLRTEGGGPSLARGTAEPGSAWLRARLSPGQMILVGVAPDEATRSAVLSYAAAVFGTERVHDAMAVAPGHGPEGWRTAALASIDALSKLATGETSVADGRIEVSGVTTTPLSAREAHLALAVADGWVGETRVTVDLPGRVAGLRLGPGPCAEKLTAIARDTPILFAPGSAEIDADSAPVLDAIAGTLGRCGGGAIEIGGHTDSQGSAGYNLRLSEDRAAAVRSALIARGVAPGLLVARGYGQTEPIAENTTEAGRTRNRRIAFSPVAPTAEVKK